MQATAIAAAQICVTERQVSRLPVRRRKATPTIDARIADGSSPITLERKLARLSQLGYQRVELLSCRDDRVVFFDGVGGWRVIVDQRAKSQTREQLITTLAGGPLITQGFEIHIDGNVGADGDELATSERIFAVREERLPVLALRQVASLVEQCVETAERGNEVNRALLADTGTPATLSLVSPTSASTSTTRMAERRTCLVRGFVKPRSVLTRIVDTNTVV